MKIRFRGNVEVGIDEVINSLTDAVKTATAEDIFQDQVDRLQYIVDLMEEKLKDEEE